MKKVLRILIYCACCAQIAVSLFVVGGWYKEIMRLYALTYTMPPEYRLFTMAQSEAEAIVAIRRNIQPNEGILWLPDISPMVNGCVYPVRIYQIKKHNPSEDLVVDTSFLTQRNIKYVFYDYGKIYHLENVSKSDGVKTEIYGLKI
jgi:hypothetical protein